MLLPTPGLPRRAFAENQVAVSIDKLMWNKWGFRYPATYVFRLTGIQERPEVQRRDEGAATWIALPEKASGERFNGIECVRFDRNAGKAYVSVGFHESPAFELRLVGVDRAVFESVAPYYDHRKAVYTLSNDNWGRKASANPGAAWQGMTNDASDSNQAAVHACRMHGIPVSVAINSRSAGGEAMWDRMQEELDRGDCSWEPVVHTRTHPCNAEAYAKHGGEWEILGCRDDILQRLTGIPYGPYLFEFILPCGYKDAAVQRAAIGQFLFLRDWDQRDNPASTTYAAWNRSHRYYGIGGLQTIAYDPVFHTRKPPARYDAADVARLNHAFDEVCRAGGIFYAMWHADRYQNSVIYDPRPGVDGTSGSSFMQHLAHVARRPEVWYVANGWLYSYRYVAENVAVRPR